EITEDLRECCRGKIRRRPGGEMESGRVERARADRVIGAVVAPGFVDRKQLHQPKTDLPRPINELTQTFEVADSQIVLTAKGKKGGQDPGNAFVRRKKHQGND